jgi:hypothetical protein
MKRFRLAWTVCTFVWLTLFAARAEADEAESSAPQLPVRKASISFEKGMLRATLSFRDLLEGELLGKISSGLPMTIALRGYLLREGDSSASPIALSVRTCRIVYDLWDEVYRIKISSGGVDRDVAALSVEGASRQCLELKDAVMFEQKLLKADSSFFIGFIAQVNPVSREMQKELRLWVSRPASISGIGPSDALFGTFVALFTQKLGEGIAASTLRFRTSAFTAPPAP